MEEIKNCPFCGSEAEVISNNINDTLYYKVMCKNRRCGIQSNSVKVGLNERFEYKTDVQVSPIMAINHVIGLWNARAESPKYPWEIKKGKNESQEDRKMIETDMKKCPFCGGSATIVKREGILGGVAYQPVCNYCKASFYPLNTGHYIKFNGEDNVFVTDRMVIDSIIKEWNSRIGEE